MNRQTLRELAVFGLLLAIGVLGRWVQPDWNFTPLAAVTVIGGYYFRNLLPAVLLPVSILAVSDLALPAHDSWGVQLSVHLMMLVPLALGRFTRGAEGWQAAGRWALCGLVPATAFYVVTNFADPSPATRSVHWAVAWCWPRFWRPPPSCRPRR